ncbi:signal peptidase I [Enterococcus sp. LJL128]
MDEFVDNLKKMKRTGNSSSGKRQMANKRMMKSGKPRRPLIKQQPLEGDQRGAEAPAIEEPSVRRKKLVLNTGDNGLVNETEFKPEEEVAETTDEIKKVSNPEKKAEEISTAKKSSREEQDEEQLSKKKVMGEKKEQGQKSKSKPAKKKRKKLSKEELARKKKQRKKQQIIEVIKFLGPVTVMAFIVFMFIFKTSPHVVDGDSMKPTLLSGDKVIVKRTKTPDRYEIITFDPPVDSDYQYVKRVIGMPGDSIWIDGADLFINQSGNVPAEVPLNAANELPDGTIKVALSSKALEQFEGLEKIPDDFYFVLGDNRNNSSDSREFGLVSGRAIEGVVSFRFSPFQSMGWIK